jgi:regulatory protein
MEGKPVKEIIDDLVPKDEDDRFADPKKVRKRAMDLLARREHGSEELCRKLVKAGFDSDVVADEVAKLTAEGLQSDTRFVEAFVQSRINQGKGPARIRAELGQKHISDSAIDIGIVEAGADWGELARETRARKFGIADPADYKEKARQMRFLQYRGFESDHIRRALASFDD